MLPAESNPSPNQKNPHLQSIESFWQMFKAKVYPGDNWPHDQINQLRKAFFGSAHCICQTVKAISSPAVSEEEGAEWFENFNNEMESFGREVKEEARRHQEEFERRLRSN